MEVISIVTSSGINCIVAFNNIVLNEPFLRLPDTPTKWICVFIEKIVKLKSQKLFPLLKNEFDKILNKKGIEKTMPVLKQENDLQHFIRAGAIHAGNRHVE